MEADVKAPLLVDSPAFAGSLLATHNLEDNMDLKQSDLGKNGLTRPEIHAKESPVTGDLSQHEPREAAIDVEDAEELPACAAADDSEAEASRTLARLSICDSTTINYVDYESERQMPDITGLITLELSEPYSIYTYRYFLHNWPHLSYLAYAGAQCVGAVVCKLDFHQSNALRGYIAMLVVHKDFRRHKIGSSLVERAIQRMMKHGCDEIVLETEVTNQGALRLYENLGFVRDKRLLRYYLNGVDAWRLKLWLK